MKIKDAIGTLQAEINFSRTPSGRTVTERVSEALQVAIGDKDNWEQNVVKCLNCCIIQSSLLVPNGCPNCGCKDFSNNVTNEDILL